MFLDIQGRGRGAVATMCTQRHAPPQGEGEIRRLHVAYGVIPAFKALTT